MPTYEFHHILPLGRSQKANLARLITDWHATTFKAPRFIVNCRFIDIRAANTEDFWVGGHELKTNKLMITLRSGTGRTEEQYKRITTKLVSMWNELTKDIQASEREKELRDVFVMGVFDSAYERGFFLPMPGKFEPWVAENETEFQKLANGCDVVFKDLIQEIQERPGFGGGPQTSSK
ncbi:putative oxalocrotonate tautomerase enzyme-domain-containing protein [Colletotrichum phormii]|uniref:Oxalocrotonate tautomerase enzyme-domain-containing protein n=1 Tax=Colletotrichum phormii TaxID=359342 RepID=A0AAJ0EJB5_9PEZI|nr:putative oxalocrotonate tautomerase enzyme-domain-containing protein [Colletotrichum phormii]KAK1638876.1 putative oxalocrotonate tautomerase enzyme-domain-containing protein [Colletotrichum phormii]